MKNTLNKRTVLMAAMLVVGFIGLCAFTAVTWKKYSNEYISFKYPDTYKITDEEESEDSYALCCEIDSDDLSMVQISLMSFGDDEELDAATKKIALKMGADAMKSEVEGNDIYDDVRCTAVKEVTKGKNVGYGFTFSATLLSIPIKGECFMSFTGNTLLALVMQAENSSYMKELNQIAEGMVVK